LHVDQAQFAFGRVLRTHFHAFRLDLGGLDEPIRVSGAAMAGINMHPEGFRILLEHRDLPRQQIVFVLLVVLRRDGEQRLVVRIRVHPWLAGLETRGRRLDAAGPFRNGASLVAGAGCPDRRQRRAGLAELGNLRVRQLGQHWGRQAEREQTRAGEAQRVTGEGRHRNHSPKKSDRQNE
jgi:hypothetical protein